MTTEEKAKAYDEAKARISKAYNDNRCSIVFMNEIFPELKENEDEKISTAIIKHFKRYKEKNSIVRYYGVNYDTIIAWLKKQGGQELPKWSEKNERIRKAIIDGLREMKNSFHTISSIKIDDAIAWLEKQGEQKPAAWSEEDEKIYQSIIRGLSSEQEI